MNTSKQFITLIFLVLFSPSIGQDLNENLLLNYLFSNNYLDETPNQFHGTPQNVNFTEDRFGSALQATYYDGSSCVEFPNDPILKPQFPFSIAVWVKPEVEFLRAEGIVGTDQFLDNYYGAFVSILQNGKLLVGYGDACGTTGPICRVSEVSNRVFVNDEWYHIAAIFHSSSEIELYINGCLEDTTESGTGTQVLRYSDEPGAAGKKDHSDIVSNPIGFFHGTIDDLYYWDRSLNGQDIAKLVDNYFQNNSTAIEYLGCQNDGYFVEVNGTIYSESNPTGFEIFTNSNGCDSIVSVQLEFLENVDIYTTEFVCDDPTFFLEINNNIYDINNPSGIEAFQNLNGCISNQYIELSFGNSTNESISYEGCQGDGYFVVVNENTYNALNPIGTEYLNNEAGCDSIVEVELRFNPSNVITYEEVICDDPEYSMTIDNIEYDIDNPQGMFSSTNQFGCDSTTLINLIYSSSFLDTFVYSGCEGDNFEVEFNDRIYNENNPTGNEEMLTSFGCDSTITVRLLFEPILECKLFLPNVISKAAAYPNNSFELFKDPDCPWEFDQIHIFDRWGNRVFVSTEENFSWKGFSNGDFVLDGVYSYILYYATKQKAFTKTGTITFLNN